jgi:hypothetical protein
MFAGENAAESWVSLHSEMGKTQLFKSIFIAKWTNSDTSAGSSTSQWTSFSKKTQDISS